jgi:hypothetical protein
MNQRTIRLPRRVITLVAAGGLATTGAAALATGWTAEASPGDTHQVWVCLYVGSSADRVLKPGKNPLLVDEASVAGGTFQGTHDDAVIVQVGGEDPGREACLPVSPPSTTATVPSTVQPSTTMATTTTAITTEPTTTEPTTTEPTTAEPTITEPTTAEPTTTVPTTTTVVDTEPTTATATTTSRGNGGGDGGGTVTTAPDTTPATTTVPPTTTVPVSTTTVPVATTNPAGGSGGAGGTKIGGTNVVPGVGAPHTGGEGQVPSGHRLLGSGLLASGLALAAGEALRRRREKAAR